MSSQRHIAILGAGPGGYVAAIRAAQLGARVTVIENQALGGVCLNWGCIPSKALLAVVELGEKLKKADDLGLQLPHPPAYDPVRMVARKNRIVSGLVKGIATLLKRWGIVHVQGTGRLVNDQTIHVSSADGMETTIQADGVIIATGSSAAALPIVPVDGVDVMTSREALDIPRIPGRLLIIGGGVEGCEFASLYAGLGSHVTIVETRPSLLPAEDEAVSTLIERELTRRRVRCVVDNVVTHVDRTASGIGVDLASGESLVCDGVLVAVGRRMNTAGIGLEEVGVTLGDAGEIVVNERMQTNVPGVFAIGDVVGGAMLAHVASAQGKVAVSNLVGHAATMRYDVVPAGIFTLPEIGRVGLTERQIREQGIAPRIGQYRYGGLGKAHAVGDTVGLVKILADPKTDRVLGAHLVGAHAADLVHEAALAMQLRATVSQMATMIHAHPTHAEALMEAAEDVDGLAIHLMGKRL